MSKKRNRPGTKTRRQISGHVKLILNANDDICYICRCKILLDQEMNKDHVFPESQGYSFFGNMMPTHKACNSDKGDRFPTLEEISFACESYEKAGLVFDPCFVKTPLRKIMRPFEFYVHQLKVAA